MALLSFGSLLLAGPAAWAQPAPLDYFSVAPCRLLDTRVAGQGPALVSGASRIVTVAGACGIPASARAIAANITAVAPSANGNLRLFPGDGGVPPTSALNFGAGRTRANNGVFPLAGNGDGTLAIHATVSGGGAVHAVLDVTGYFAAPLDLIVVVDTSGSMDDEVVQVESGLNTLAALLRGKGFDLHLIVIADSAFCVPAPLGSGSCPADENLPGYRHVVMAVGSNNSLQRVLDAYPQYSASLRPGAHRAFVEVSDDDSSLTAPQFTVQLFAKDSGFNPFQFNAIAAFRNPAPGTVCNPLVAAAEGVVYKQLVAQTGGTFYDLCLQDFTPAWPQIADAIAAFGP